MSHSVSDRLIVASAASFESQLLLQALARLAADVTFIEVGVSSITSSGLASRLVDIIRGRDVLFVGSCGISSPFDHPKLFAINRVKWAPVDVRRGDSYLVNGSEPELVLNGRLDLIRGLEPGCASCSSSISLLHELKSDQVVLENLELYSAAKAWSYQAKSFTAILGTTNQIGPNAHSEWKKNFRLVAKMTANHIDSSYRA